MRTFVAFQMSQEIHAALRAAQRAMGRLNGVGWTDPANIHLTLKFIGEIEDRKLPAVFEVMRQAVKGVAPIEIAVRGLGWFPPGRRPRVVWAGVESDTDVLVQVSRRLDEGLAELGVPREGRAFKPHLTMGRARGTIDAEAIEAAFGRVSRSEFGREVVDELVLFMSELQPSGAVYTRMGAVPLEGANEEEG